MFGLIIVLILQREKGEQFTNSHTQSLVSQEKQEITKNENERGTLLAGNYGKVFEYKIHAEF